MKKYYTFFDFDQYLEARKLGEIVAVELVQAGPEKIDTFLSEAAEFAGAEFAANRIIDVSNALADFWDEKPFINQWTDATLRDGDGEVLDFSFYLIRSRLRILRAEKRGPELSYLLRNCFNLLATTDRRSQFLLVQFRDPHPLNFGPMTTEDLQFLHAVNQNDDYTIAPERGLQCLLGMHHVDEPLILQMAQDIWNNQPLASRLSCYLSILQALHFVDLFRVDYPQLGVTHTIYRWLIALLVNLPDIDDINDNALHAFDQFMGRFGKMPFNCKRNFQHIYRKKKNRHNLHE